jgi:hypothetical protein
VIRNETTTTALSLVEMVRADWLSEIRELRDEAGLVGVLASTCGGYFFNWTC